MTLAAPPTPLESLFESLREAALTNRDLGDRFERLILAFLRHDPVQAERFSDVWLWSDWPDRGRRGDTGIDIVAKERATGDYCAIQCKFYLPDHTVSRADIDSFIAASIQKPFTSRMLVTTTDRWGKNAEDLLSGTPGVTRITIRELQESPLDWSKFDPRKADSVRRKPRKSVLPHQEAAIADVVKGLATADRGKLVMACGTGKTFTALRIAERLAPTGRILFLVPSLSLLAQSLREWTAEAKNPLRSLAACSDTSVGKRNRRRDDDLADISVHDLAFPATTSGPQLADRYRAVTRRQRSDAEGMTVVFATYQSIKAVSDAQRKGLPEFDLVICDEAHRTTGVTLAGEDESAFVKVHDAKFIKGRKRLYMTATPRIYSDEARGRAAEADAELCSMDDVGLFGEELHRLGFGDAVGRNLLSDYKVLVLAVDERAVSRTFQRQLADAGNELRLDDAARIVGCWQGLAKRIRSPAGRPEDLHGDEAPMRRAVAFSRSIEASKAFVAKFRLMVESYREAHPDATDVLGVDLEHVDGTFSALRRGELLDWLKDDPGDSTCRILSNARCLSEGVDVPALDAVLFLNPRNSVIDVVQSVGRVMRRAEGKRYGYIILPIGIPADRSPEEALQDNDRYKVVWQVLQALRAHDDRFNATINQIELNRNRPDTIQVIGVGGDPGEALRSDGDGQPAPRELQHEFAFPHLEEWRDAIYGRIVLKCGDRRYWESWAKDVAVIAERHVDRITTILEGGRGAKAKAFEAFLAGLRANLNPEVSREDAIEMLSQHLITRPVFEALFEGYAFAEKNPVSKAMQNMLDALQDENLSQETESLSRFYASVRDRARGIDNAEGRQRVVIELYDKFFRTAFPRMAERLGIVYTPIEVVDFIVRSVEDLLRSEFGSGLGQKDVHVIDPFTGTGTFIVRLLQSGLIPDADLKRKYERELHANEIVLLAYYIAAINIEEAFHSRLQGDGARAYRPFEGIVLTDTFQLYESRGELAEYAFPENHERVRRQKKAPIRVVIANPPYSAHQTSQNDNNQNLEYPHLDAQIERTYASRSKANLVKNLYDSYVRAIRWATDRIDERGIVGFVTNGSFIDANNMDGLRACLAEEFSSVYVFNLRGNQRTSGERSRQEGGKIFGSGSRAPIAITLMVRNPKREGPCELRYCDIGDYLSRDAKLNRIRELGSVEGIAREGKWTRIQPNPEHDWTSQRDPAFGAFVSLGDKDGKESPTFFSTYSLGVVTNRDAWMYNMSRSRLEERTRAMIRAYNAERKRYRDACGDLPKHRWPKLESVIDSDPRRIRWTANLKEFARRNRPISPSDGTAVESMYRPFVKQWLFFSRPLNERVCLIPSLFPTEAHTNLVISATGIGATKHFSALVTREIPNLHLHDTGQCFPLYYYEAPDPDERDLFAADGELIDGFYRRSAITDGILAEFRAAYGGGVAKEDIFYYVYGVLHSPEYRTRFAADLKRMLPRVPLTKAADDFRRFVDAGRELARWHLDYERVDPYPLEERSDVRRPDPSRHYIVEKMSYGRLPTAQHTAGEKWDKSTIVYNSHITLAGVPDEAFEYVVNGKPAIEWIMERYQVSRDPDSGIVNDPNDWAREHDDPRYILDLVKRIVRVSVETMRIVRGLPALNER